GSPLFPYTTRFRSGHALLERLVRTHECELGLAERGHVGERRDETAARHRVAADLDDRTVREAPLGEVCGAVAHLREAARDTRFDVAVADHAALDVVAREVRDRPTDREQSFR